MSLIQTLRERSRALTTHPFVIDRGRVLTYGDAYSAASRAAGEMAASGVRPGDSVLLAVPNSPEFCILLYGALMAGASAVLVNPRLTAYEIDAAKRLTRPRLAIGSGFGMTAPEILLSGISPLEPRRNPTGIALMLLTSGTTGLPKAVMLSDEAVTANATQLAARKYLTYKDRFLCSIPLYHSNGQVAALQSMLVAGATLVLMERFSPEALADHVKDYGVTAISGVPTIYQRLVNFHERNPVDLSTLRLCISGSAPLSVNLFEEVERRFGAFILEGYGLTETSAGAAGNPIARRKPGTVGTALDGTEIRVVDAEGRPLPAGHGLIGEIEIRGPQLMSGYFENPEATAAALTPEGWLRSGDLGDLDADGYLSIRSRKKELIIRGGFNVYPAEVENALQGIDGVLETAALGLSDSEYGEAVHVALISELESHAAADRIRAACEEKLARYKRPTSFSLHRDFPRTGSAKVQRAKLRELLEAEPKLINRL